MLGSLKNIGDDSDGNGTIVALSLIIVMLIGVIIGVSVWYVLKQRKQERLAVAKMQGKPSTQVNKAQNLVDRYIFIVVWCSFLS